jgi:parallel beta-helix repeat protein
MSKEIWIAAGTYTPGRTPEDYLLLTANTSYIGGFAGWETDKGQRNVAANMVIISGDLGGGVKAENLFETPYTVEIRESSWGSYPSKTYTPINGNLSFENLRLENSSSYGIYTASMTSGSFTLTESRFTSCGVFCSASSGSATIQVTDTEIRGGTYGMSMYSDSGRVLIDRVTITGVSSRGMYVSSNNTVLINNSTISNCGFGVYMYGSGNQEIRGSTISGNTGCGLEVSGGTCTMNGGTISNNTNDWSGGGVSIQNGTTFIMNGGTISGNSATSALYNGLDLAEGGGVMCWEGANFIMRGGTISGNSAAYKGGGVSLRTGTITKTGGTIYGSDGGANANKCIRADGWGRAVFKSISGYVSDYRYVDTTLGPSDNLSW